MIKLDLPETNSSLIKYLMLSTIDGSSLSSSGRGLIATEMMISNNNAEDPRWTLHCVVFQWERKLKGEYPASEPCEEEAATMPSPPPPPLP